MFSLFGELVHQKLWPHGTFLESSLVPISKVTSEVCQNVFRGLKFIPRRPLYSELDTFGYNSTGGIRNSRHGNPCMESKFHEAIFRWMTALSGLFRCGDSGGLPE